MLNGDAVHPRTLLFSCHLNPHMTPQDITTLGDPFLHLENLKRSSSLGMKNHVEPNAGNRL